MHSCNIALLDRGTLVTFRNFGIRAKNRDFLENYRYDCLKLIKHILSSEIKLYSEIKLWLHAEYV